MPRTLSAQSAEAWRRQPLNVRLKLLHTLIAEEYWHDPVGFIERFIRWPAGQEGLAPYQAEAIAQIPVRLRVSVRGPHGLGKTTSMALVIIWFAITRELRGADWKIPTTASEFRQLRQYLWPEVHKWARLIDWAGLGLPAWREDRELLDMGIKLDHGQAFALASKDPAAIEGAHADHLLYIFDEAKTIIDGTFDAAEGAFSNAGTDGREAYALAFSTPGEPNGRFYDIQSKNPKYKDWWVRAVALQEAIAARRVGDGWADDRKLQWGETSALYINRVLGNFATSEKDAVIPLSWVEAAIARGAELVDQLEREEVTLMPLTSVGVDVARSGEDETVLALRHGHAVPELRVTALEDTMETAGKAAGILRAHQRRVGQDGIEPVQPYAAVDVIGIGAGVVDRLRELGFDVEAFNASGRSELTDESGELGFINRRAEAWWTMRVLLNPTNGHNIALVDDENSTLQTELTTPRWRVTSMGGGRIQVESKDEIRKRLRRSTDRADAVVMAFAQRYETEEGYVVWEDRVEISPY